MDEKKRILIVDDNEGIRKSLALILSKYGYETEEARTGGEAMEKVRERFFNAVLLDIKLPDTEGIELIAPMKARYLDMVVIMITGYASVENAVRALHMGASAYITKPFDMEELLDTVRKALDKQRLVRERQEAEETLRVSEQKFRDLVETTTDWVWEVDTEGVYTYVSPKVKELLGYEVSEVLGKTLFDLKPEEEVERIVKFFNEKVINKEPFYGLENVNRHKDGHFVVLETSAIPIFNERGQLKGYRGIDRDITERKKMDEALKQSEQKYKFLVDNSSELIFILNKKGNILFVNKKAIDVSGYSEENIIGKSILKLLTKDSIPRALYSMGQEFLGRPQPTMEFKIKTKSGEIRHIETAAGSIPVYEKEKWMGILINGRDVTERKQKLEEIELQRKWLESFVKYSPLGIITVDKNVKIISCNSTFEEIFQYKESEILGKNLDELITGNELIEESRALSKKTIIDGLPSKITTRRKRKDGTWFDTEIFAVPVKIGNNLVGQFGMYHNITERMRTEEELKKRLDQLEVYYKATMGREGRVIELKHEVNELLEQLSKEKKYMV